MTTDTFEFASKYSPGALDSLLGDIKGKPATPSPQNTPQVNSGGSSPTRVKPEGPTRSSIISAKSKAVGGMRKRCRKGKNCSATCIAQNDECLVDLSPEVGVALKQVSRMLRSMVARRQVTTPQAESVITELKSKPTPQRAKAFAEFAKGVKEGKFSEADKQGVAKLLISTIITPGQDRGASRKLSYDEILKVLKPGNLEAFDSAYKASFGADGKFNPGLKGGMSDLIQSKFIKNKISDEAALTAYNMLPALTRAAINKAGAVKQMYAGEDANGNVRTSATATQERGVFLVKRWMEQGGLDPYSGKRVDIRKAEPEHLVAFMQAAAKGGGGDQPKNLLWAATNTNNQKAGSGDNFMQWKKRLEEYKAMGRDEYNNKIYGAAQAKSAGMAAKKGGAESEVQKAMDAATPKERAAAMKALVASYGADVRYLLRASGVNWQHSNKDPEYRLGQRVAKMDDGLVKLPGFTAKVKPSQAVMMALSVIKPENKKDFVLAVDKLRKERQFTDAEAKNTLGNPDKRNAVIREKSAAYGQNLTKLLNQYIPELGDYL